VEAEIADWYERLLVALKGSDVGHGHFDCLAAPDGTVAVRWQSELDRFDVAAVNFTATPQRLEVQLPTGGWQVQDYLQTATGSSNLNGKMCTVLGGRGVGFWRFRREQQKF
jgi:hypothetical protein